MKEILKSEITEMLLESEEGLEDLKWILPNKLIDCRLCGMGVYT